MVASSDVPGFPATYAKRRTGVALLPARRSSGAVRGAFYLTSSWPDTMSMAHA